MELLNELVGILTSFPGHSPWITGCFKMRS